MKKFLSFVVLILAVGMVLILPSTKDLVFCYKKITKAQEITDGSSDIKTALDIKAKSSILMDAKSEKILYGDNYEQHLAPASMTKVMTLLLVMEEVEKGNLALNQPVLISEYSASQEGSECFLDANKSYTLIELIKSVAVASANDSAVALAECVAGDEKLFVKKMNQRATELGMANTNFVNCTGLDCDNHYSCAKDLCLAIRALSKYSLISELEKVWTYDMEHANGRITSLTNTNKLIRTNPDLYMAKTGHTDDAGYCIVGLCKRDNMELIACVMGVDETDERFLEENKLFNYGFTNFESVLVLPKFTKVGTLAVKRGTEKQVDAITKEDIFMLKQKGVPKKETTLITTFTYNNLSAPINENTVIGKVSVLQDDEEIGSTEILTANNIEKLSYKDLVTKLIGECL